MKQILFFSFALSILFFSCKKEKVNELQNKLQGKTFAVNNISGNMSSGEIIQGEYVEKSSCDVSKDATVDWYFYTYDYYKSVDRQGHKFVFGSDGKGAVNDTEGKALLNFTWTALENTLTINFVNCSLNSEPTAFTVTTNEEGKQVWSGTLLYDKKYYCPINGYLQAHFQTKRNLTFELSR
jgi:hypothetical protein